MVIANVILGLLLLIAGRKLFWFSVAIIGFLAGFELLAAQLTPMVGPLEIVLAIFFGLLCAVLAIAYQWVVVIMMGFLGGGYFLMNVFLHFVIGPEQFSLWLFAVGGIIGILVMLLAFDWALIWITSLLGAMLVVGHLNMAVMGRSLLFVGCVLFGCLVQYVSFKASIEEGLNATERRVRKRTLLKR